MKNPSNETQVAVQTARKAAKIIKSYRDKKNFTIESKAKNDLVTDADLESERVIKEAIQEAFPDDVIMAEESTEERKLSAERTWIIDPIDGTTNFSHGFPSYCVSIAFWVDKRPRAGVILEVANDELFVAEKDKGAYMNGETITISPIKNNGRLFITF